MASTYATFLQSPSTSLLAADASLNYITTTTTISEPTAILKHLASQQKLAEKKSERIISSIEGPDSLFLETETTLKFVQGGGAYLPALDENLLDEKLAIFPLLHVVHFDSDKKIKQIRLHWDQGSLLKQVEAIGRTGRNWPIRDGKAQVDAISKSVNASGGSSSSNGSQEASKTPLAIRSPNEVVINQNPKRDSVGALRNQPASLSLFAPRDHNEDASSAYDGPKTAVRDSARPAPRDMAELFVGEATPATAIGIDPSKERSLSPSKGERMVLKSGAGKHFNEIRLFDENDKEGGLDSLLKSPGQSKKTYQQKYDHFSFGNGEDDPLQQQQNSRPSTRGYKGGPTFSFEDFHTPPKYLQKKRPDDEVHWGNEELPPSPPKRPIVHAPRKDADPQYAFTNPASLSPAHPQPSSLQQQSREAGLSLYRDPVALAAEGKTNPGKPAPTTTNVDAARRGGDFAAKFQFGKPEAVVAENVGEKGRLGSNNEENRPMSSSSRSDMETHWSWGKPEEEKKIYKTAGDGMGGRSGARKWSFGAD